MLKVIDVSKFQGNIDWAKVKSQVGGAIIRLGYRGYSTGAIATDPKAWQNIKGVQDNGIPFGVYFFPCSISYEEAIQEADWIYNQVKNLKLSFPIYLDSEVAEAVRGSGRADKLSVADRTKYLKTIIERLNEHGYTVGVYASKNWFETHLNVPLLPACKLWVAQYASKCTYNNTHAAWQYTSTGKITGISGNVDISYYYDDFAQNPAVKSDLKSTGVIALEVIDGKWGVAPLRKGNLTKAGYDYNTVQKRVNDILKTQKDIESSAKTLASAEKSIETYTKKRDAENETLTRLRSQLVELSK